MMKLVARLAVVVLSFLMPMSALAAFAVYFSGDDVTDAAVRDQVSKNPLMKSVHFYKTPNVSDAAFDCLSNRKDLEFVTCVATNFTGTGLKALRGLPKLRKLELEDCPLTEVGLKELPQLDVTSVNFYESTVTDRGAWYISYTPTLEYVNVSKAQLSDIGLAYMVRLPELKYLYLLGANVTDQSAEILAKMKKLSFLDLRETRIGDKTLKQLATLPNLKTLLVRDTGVTKEAIDEFKKKRPGVTISDGQWP